jgi:hypothetical protein
MRMSAVWIDGIPLGVLLVIALPLGLVPFMPEPHVWQKLKTLFAGTLVRPIDIFDLFLHGGDYDLVTGSPPPLFVRDRAGRWTDEYLHIRAEMGAPAYFLRAARAPRARNNTQMTEHDRLQSG